MNCQEFWSQTPQAGALPAAEWSAHLEECSACAGAWERQWQVAAGLRQVAAEWSRLEAPARLEGRLVKAFRARSGPLPIRRLHRPWLGALAWATAAAGILALAVSLVRVHEPATTGPRRIPAQAAILASAQDPPAGPLVESATLDNGFVPLPNVEQLDAGEQGDVVRLELPRSAMMAVGFEVSPERAAEPIQAEVIYGPDGVARAVRFLDVMF